MLKQAITMITSQMRQSIYTKTTVETTGLPMTRRGQLMTTKSIYSSNGEGDSTNRGWQKVITSMMPTMSWRTQRRRYLPKSNCSMRRLSCDIEGLRGDTSRNNQHNQLTSACSWNA